MAKIEKMSLTMASLKELSVWVNFQHIPDMESPGSFKRVLINPKTRKKVQNTNDNKRICGKFKEAESQYMVKRADGIGLMCTGYICGIVIDNCVHCPNRKQLAQDIMKLMGNTYVEFSPDGNSYHMIFNCNIFVIPKLYERLHPAYRTWNERLGIKIFIPRMSEGYLPYTDNIVTKFPIEDKTEELEFFMKRYMRKTEGIYSIMNL